MFPAAGECLGSFGGRGDGLGEFRTLRRIENAGDTLLALDRGSVNVAAHDLMRASFCGRTGSAPRWSATG